MKCLSLWQPWATLLVTGSKQVETRGWPIRHRGPLLIHAAKRWTTELADLAETEPFLSALLANVATSEMWRASDLPFGAIVGRVDVTGCVPTDRVGRWEQDPMAPTLNYFFDNLGVMGPADGKPFLFVSEDERAFGDYSPNRFAFLCKNPVRFETPIPFRGMQSLFDVPDELVKSA